MKIKRSQVHSRPPPVSGGLWAVLSFAVMLCSCQATLRPVADALDKVTADERKARISDLSYDVFIDLAASDAEYVGEVRIEFNLADANSDLSLDFTGGTLQDVRVNGEKLSAGYNGYFLTLPAGQLRTGANEITIAYRHAYGHDGNGLHRFVDPEDGRIYMHS
jgi:aminopeptidase N